MFIYLGLKVNECVVVYFVGYLSCNLFVVGEMMVGNVLGKGYIVGVGMFIGIIFGCIVGIEVVCVVYKEV